MQQKTNAQTIMNQSEEKTATYDLICDISFFPNFGPPQEATFRATSTKVGADGCMFSQAPSSEFEFLSKMLLYT